MEPKLDIKYWRRKCRITQHELSERVNISDNYLSELENGHKYPTLYILYKIADALEVCPRQLLRCQSIECKSCSYNILCKKTEGF